MIDTRREAREAKADGKLYGWIAFSVLAFVGLMVVVGVKLPRPSHEELARRAIATEAKRRQDQAAGIRQTKDAVERCANYVRKISPNYNQTFNAYVDATGYHWTKFMTDFGGAEFQWHKCMASMGHPVD